MTLSSQEQKQYSRHLILEDIGGIGQLKLKKAKVLVVGAGGLGCPALQYIAAAGVGTIGIIDHDKIDQSNLQRQILYTHNDIGNFKAIVAANRLSLLNPFLDFKVYTELLSKENALELFSKFDIVIDGSDNFPTRYLVNDACVITNKPLVFGSIFKFEGQISVFNYKKGPTYRCLFPNPPKSNQVPNCSEMGVLGVLPGIIGTLQANEALKIICGIGDVLSGKLLAFNALSLKQTLLSFEKNTSISINSLDNNDGFSCEYSIPVKELVFLDYKNQQANFNLLDVRTQAEHHEFNIGGLHIPLNELSLRLEEVPQSKNLLVYCKSGMRSKSAVEILQNTGLKNELFSLKGGLMSSF